MTGPRLQLSGRPTLGTLFPTPGRASLFPPAAGPGPRLGHIPPGGGGASELERKAVSEGWGLPVRVNGTLGNRAHHSEIQPGRLHLPDPLPSPQLSRRTSRPRTLTAGEDDRVRRLGHGGAAATAPITKPGGCETRKVFIERYKSITAETYSNKLGGGREGQGRRGAHVIQTRTAT